MFVTQTSRFRDYNKLGTPLGRKRENGIPSVKKMRLESEIWRALLDVQRKPWFSASPVLHHMHRVPDRQRGRYLVVVVVVVGQA